MGRDALTGGLKTAFVADLMGGDSDIHLVTTAAPLSTGARTRLSLLYDRAVARRGAVQRIVEALATRGLIGVTRRLDETDRVHLIQNDAVESLLKNPTFGAERERLKRLRRVVPHLRTMTLATVKERLFDDREVRTWGE